MPGKGLVVYHVNYDHNRWRENSVNGVKNQLNFSLVSADNMDYTDWTLHIEKMGYSRYQNSGWMNSRVLSSASYPWTTDSTTTVLDYLTSRSLPSTKMYHFDNDGSIYLSKAITNITLSSEGLVSFDLVSDASAIDAILPIHSSSATSEAFFDLQGRPLSAPPSSGVYLIRRSDGTIHKQLK